MKVCFIGSGSIGQRHIQNWIKICDAHNTTCEIHLLRATSCLLSTNIKCFVHKEIRELQDLDTYYDAIFVTNPTYLHYTTLEKLKHYSKCFFVEKPVFENYNYNLEDLKLPEGNKYYVACPLRYTQVIEYAKALLRSEEIYSIRAISSSYLPDWRTNADYRNSYSAHKDQGGGVRIDLIHEWDYITYLFGFPKTVKLFYGKYSNLEIDSEDIAIYIAEYSDKLCEIHLDYLGRQPERKLELRTKDATYCIDILNASITKNGSFVCKYDEQPNDKYMMEMTNFWKIAFEDGENTNTLEHALDVLKLAMNP